MRDSKIALTIPTVLVGIVPIYKLPGNPELNFSGGLLAEIFLATVKNWMDPQIARLNPSVELPDLTHFCRTPQSGEGIEFYLHRLSVENQCSVSR